MSNANVCCCQAYLPAMNILFYASAMFLNSSLTPYSAVRWMRPQSMQILSKIRAAQKESVKRRKSRPFGHTCKLRQFLSGAMSRKQVSRCARQQPGVVLPEGVRPDQGSAEASWTVRHGEQQRTTKLLHSTRRHRSPAGCTGATRNTVRSGRNSLACLLQRERSCTTVVVQR